MPTRTLEVPVLIAEAEDCTACAERLRTLLGEMRGIDAAELDTTRRRLTLTYDPALLSLPALEARVREAGIALTRRFRHATLRLEGLHCPDCAQAVEHAKSLHFPSPMARSSDHPPRPA